jgi:hypothetical protein
MRRARFAQIRGRDVQPGAFGPSPSRSGLCAVYPLDAPAVWGLGLVIRTQDHDCDIRLPRLSLISLIQPSTCYN